MADDVASITKEQATLQIVRRYVADARTSLSFTDNPFYNIPAALVSVIANYIGNWFNNHGVYRWKITSRSLVEKVLNATCGEKFESDIFYLSRLPCKITIYPNGTKRELEGFFVIHLHFMPMPHYIDKLIFTRVFRVKESMTGNTWRSVVSNGDYEYWTKHCPLFELQMLKLSTITIEIEMNIEKIIMKDSCYPLCNFEYAKMLKNTCFPMKSRVEYQFDETTIQIMKQSKLQKSMCSQIADKMWVMHVYPKEDIEIYLKLCFIPPDIVGFKVQTVMKCECESVHKTRNAINIYTEQHHSWGPNEWIKMSSITNLKHMEFVIDIEILHVFYRKDVDDSDENEYISNEAEIAHLLADLQ